MSWLARFFRAEESSVVQAQRELDAQISSFLHEVRSFETEWHNLYNNSQPPSGGQRGADAVH